MRKKTWIRHGGCKHWGKIWNLIGQFILGIRMHIYIYGRYDSPYNLVSEWVSKGRLLLRVAVIKRKFPQIIRRDFNAPLVTLWEHV
ncbi:hypothetical protein AYX07_03620 [Thermoactinomyces sp. AS95]|jgi:hypothetical protein|nr:hypothetical protein AYX07_03620 [Thermoactinomyces sp. AS95]